jgi:hypothetical protein
MTGLAMETTLVNVEKAWSKLSYLNTGKSERTVLALERVADAKKVIEANYRGEERHRLSVAVVGAENVRVLRNLAAHDPAESFSVATADDLLRTTAGSIDTFYEIVVDPNTA